MTEKHLPVTGGCSCGAIRYESAEPPVNGGFCHCRQCQRETGGLFSAMVWVANTGFRFTRGEPASYPTTAALRHLFCGTCGTSISSVYLGDDVTILAVGTLDHPEDWPPDQEGWFGHVYVANKIPWEVIGDNLPQHDQEAPEPDDAINEIRQRAEENE